jgi:hypothetical protein
MGRDMGLVAGMNGQRHGPCGRDEWADTALAGDSLGRLE